MTWSPITTTIASAALGLGPQLAAPSLAQTCEYEIAHIIEGPKCPQHGPPPTPIPQAINDQTEVVGYYTVCNVGNDRAFYWSEATGLVTLRFPFPIFSSRAYDINNNGLITGAYEASGDGLGQVAFVMRPDGSEFQLLGLLLGGNYSEALAINDEDQVTGYSGNSLTSIPTSTEAFVWQDGNMAGLGTLLGQPLSRGRDINPNGLVTGWMASTQQQFAFTSDGKIVVNLGFTPGGDSGEGIVITSAPTVAGHGLVSQPDGNNYYRPFYWGGQRMTALPAYPDSGHNLVHTMDEDGTVFGDCVTLPPNVSNIGLVWRNGILTPLTDLVCTEGTLAAGSIDDVSSATGMMVGIGLLNDTLKALVFAPVGRIGDLDGDGIVNGADLGILLLNWMTTRIESDLNNDGTTDGEDLGILLLHWTR
jgi:probable HAF family extracellular repeat protein